MSGGQDNCESIKRQSAISNGKSHILIATLSVSPKAPIKYKLGDRVTEANQAPLALLQLLPADQLPDEVMILCTPLVFRNQFPTFKQLIESDNSVFQREKPIKISALNIPDGKNEREIWEILKIILNSVPENSVLTLDLTHGFRSLPFLFFTAAMYLKALRNVSVKSVYYGNIDVNTGEDTKPIIELSVILEMIEWFYAARIFKETGQANYIINLLEPFAQIPAGIHGPDCAPYTQINTLKNSFYVTASAYQQALPIEFGMEAYRLNLQLEKPLPDHVKERMPLPDELFSQIKAFIEPYLLKGFKKKNKDFVVLDKEEILRQALLVDRYFRQGNINNATTLMREWMVNVALYHFQKNRGNERIAGNDWLTYKAKRKPIEYLMNSIMNLKRNTENHIYDILSEGQNWLADKWAYITDKRNGLSHCGFKDSNSLLPEQAIEEIKMVWQELKDSVDCPEKWDVNIQYGQGTLLVSSLGKTKGALYSALVSLKPDNLYILASVESEDYIDEILDKAHWQGNRDTDLKVYVMNDPFAGFMEKELAMNLAKSLFVRAEHVVFNLTGGTTVMQYVLNQMALQFKGYTKTTKQVAFVDRRSIQEQIDDPYIVGEMIMLE